MATDLTDIAGQTAGMAMIASAPAFLGSVLDRLAAIGIDARAMPVSHLCWRVETLAEYHATVAALRPFAAAVAEDRFANRPITLLIPRVPLLAPSGAPIPLIEIPAPREGHPYPSGWEHAAFSLGGDPVAFHAANVTLLDGIKDPGLDVQSAFVTFPGGMTAKFYAAPLLEIVGRQDGWRFEAVP
jgi:predicted metalloenzyme YecM